jgi:hypothetical protein
MDEEFRSPEIAIVRAQAQRGQKSGKDTIRHFFIKRMKTKR